ncbi:MAG: hypothetical protein ACE15B_19280 [Bryobacteraceae bacterium]
MKILAVFAAALFASAGADAQEMRRAAWLQDEPLVIIGNWDAMPIFARRAGGRPVWHEEDYRKQHTEEAVRKLKEAGVTMAVIHFYKGFGLEAEREHMDEARAYAALCRKYGIRIGVYVGSTIGYETFLIEKPEAESWFAPRFLGRPLYYSDQTFRKRVYFMHPGYREYMKRVLRIAVEDIKADLIHFDNTSLQARPDAFLHPLAVEDFRAFLRSKYTPAGLTQRFGFSDVRHVEPPELAAAPAVLNDPLLQEWTDFRCRQLTAYYTEMADYIRGLNPQVAVENNPHSGISGRNTAWEQGVDYPRLLRPLDVVWTEEGNEPGVTREGVLVSKIRTYKMATHLGNRVFTYTAGDRGGKLAMAEAMAYNRLTLGMVGSGLAGYELSADERKYIRFFLDNIEAYRGVRTRADVAVLHSFASMAYNSGEPWHQSTLLEQILIQARIPFDIICDGDLKDLSRYRAVALAGQECLSEEQAAAIRDFVQRGGGLVATGDSSLYTEWRQRRRDFALADLFTKKTRRAQAGKGRVVYVPSLGRLTPATSKYWKLPVNWEPIAASVKWAAGGSASVEITAPPTLTAELKEQPGSGRTFVHLVNYARAPLSNVAVSVAVPAGKTVTGVKLLSPDAAAAAATPVVSGGRARFTVPSLKVYTVAVIDAK